MHAVGEEPITHVHPARLEAVIVAQNGSAPQGFAVACARWH